MYRLWSLSRQFHCVGQASCPPIILLCTSVTKSAGSTTLQRFIYILPSKTKTEKNKEKTKHVQLSSGQERLVLYQMLEQYVKIRILFQSIYQMLEQYVKIRILFHSTYQMLEQYVKIRILFHSTYQMLEQYVKIRILFHSTYQMLEQYVKIRILFHSIYQMLE